MTVVVPCVRETEEGGAMGIYWEGERTQSFLNYERRGRSRRLLFAAGLDACLG